jgi:hypothetical protein
MLTLLLGQRVKPRPSSIILRGENQKLLPLKARISFLQKIRPPSTQPGYSQRGSLWCLPKKLNVGTVIKVAHCSK